MPARTRTPRPRVPLSVQWHITSSCSNRCAHCYMHDLSTYPGESLGALLFPGLLAVLGRIAEFEEKYGAEVRHFAIGGGDPLLREDWADLAGELRGRGKRVSLMGNPETLTAENAARLAALGIQVFQLSLDGLEETHDRFRSAGSFGRTVRAIDLLASHGVRVGVMFTLYPANAAELLPLLRFVASRTRAHSFAFDLGCHVGNARTIERGLTPARIREIFAQYLAEKERLAAQGNRLRIIEKPSLFKVARFEKGSYHPPNPRSTPTTSGCLIGWESLCILSDGTVLPCRRLPLPIGKLPEQPFDEIFLGSPLLRRFRRRSFHEGCGECDFYAVCRGCPAYVHGVGGNPFGEYPLCFRGDVGRPPVRTHPGDPEPPIEGSLREEWAYFASRRAMEARIDEFLDEPDFQQVSLDLGEETEARKEFLFDPAAYLARRNRCIEEDGIALLLEHFARLERRNDWRDRQDPLAAHALARMTDGLL